MRQATRKANAPWLIRPVLTFPGILLLFNRHLDVML